MDGRRPVTRVSSPDLIGRAAELERLDRIWATVQSGRGRVALLAGEAGIGKSRLAADWLDRLGGDVTVATGQCLGLDEGTLPFGPFAELVRNLLRQPGGEPTLETASVTPPGWLLSDMLPVDAPLHERSGQARLFAAVARLIEQTAARRPTCLLVEDVHRLDSASLNLFRYLVHSLRHHSVLWLLTLRTDTPSGSSAVSALLADLARDAAFERIDLERFDRARVAEQVTGIRGVRPDRALVARIHEWSDGNPFLTEEVLALDLVAGHGIAPSTRDMLLSRVAPSGPELDGVLRAAAVGGKWVAQRDLADVTGLPLAALMKGLRAAVAAHLLVPDDRPEGDGFSFRHALVREAVASDLLTTERRALHERWARTLERSPNGRLGAVAEHWDRAGRPDQAIPAYLAAAEASAASFARSDAGEFLVRALDLMETVASPLPSVPSRPDVLEAAALQFEFAGERDRAIELLIEALSSLPSGRQQSRAMRLRRRIAEISGQRAHGTLSFRSIKEAMAQVGDDPDAEGAAVLAAYAMRIGMRGDLDGAWKAAERAIEAARRADAPLAEARGRQVLAQLTAMKDVDVGVAGLRSAAQLAAAVGDLDVQMEALTDISWALANAGRYADALAAIEEVYAATLAAGVSGELWPIYRARRIEYLTVLGRWPEAEGDIAAVEDSRAWTARFRAATLRAHQGRPDDAARLIDDALAIRQIDDPDVPDRGGVAIARVSLALCRAEPSRALTLVREAIPLPGEEHMEAELLCLAVRACGMAADMRPAWRERVLRSREAEAFVARLAELASAQSRAAWRPIRAQSLHAQAESARLTGGSTPEAWHAAGDAWLELEARERVAEARYREAEAVLLGRGPRRQAEAPLRTALAICDALGSTPLRAEIEALAGRARIELDPRTAMRRPPPAAPPAEAPADPHGLSSREREVLALLVAGRTNREIGAALFISPKTAGAHVSNILGKLGVANRVEAATVAHRLNLV